MTKAKPISNSKLSSNRFRSGLLYQANFVSLPDRRAIMQYLASIYPIWEMRFSPLKPLPSGQSQRQLLRPVYWLGNWQFACLNYYHPPKGIYHRCVAAEPFPSVLQKLAYQMESMAQQEFLEKDIPRNWHFNTCLINYYGNKIEEGKSIDCARVGEHRDFEPGPVGSLSFGDRALIQFVRSDFKGKPSEVVTQQWLEDSSMQLFASDRFKKQLFHRVQRVEQKRNEIFQDNTTQFKTRRINLTFRYVPIDHICELQDLPKDLLDDVTPYVKELAQHSKFFADRC